MINRSQITNSEWQMLQVGDEDSVLFSLTANELERLEKRIDSGQMRVPHRIFYEGPVGVNVRFQSLEDAMTAKLSII